MGLLEMWVILFWELKKQRSKSRDTITHFDRPCAEAIHGFEEVKPMVFCWYLSCGYGGF